MAKTNLRNLMILVLPVLLVIGVVSTAGCAGKEVVTQVIEDVTAQEAFTLIQANQQRLDFTIIDVRTPEEFARGHLENAINIDFYFETFQDYLDALDNNRTYLIYYHSGARNGSSLNTMAELNLREV